MVFNESIAVFGGLYQSWIGINDRNTEGQFVYASSEESITISNWNANQPDNYDNEDCVHFVYDLSKWNDLYCTSKNHFICEI